MKIKNKVLILMSGIFILCLFFIFLFKYYYNRRIKDIFLQTKIDKEKTLINTILELNKENLQKAVFDYTYWDDMVNFALKPDKDWAKDNLLTMLQSFNVDIVLVFDLNKNIIYNSSESDTIILFLSKEVFENLNEKKLSHFYFDTPDGLLELAGGTIHKTNDIERKKEFYGYLFVGIFWNEKYISSLEAKTKYKINLNIEKINNSFKSEVKYDSDIFIITNYLPIFNNSLSAKIDFISKNDYYEHLLFISKTEKFSISFIILIFIILFLIFHLWFYKPLKIISIGLQSENQDILKQIINKSKDEFNDIANLIINFF